MTAISPHIKRARWAVIFFFASNGFLFANWTARIPEIELFYNINHAQLGSILFTLAIGSVLAMPFAGYLNNIWGSRRVTIITGFLFTTMIMGVAIYPSIPLVYTVFFFMGVGGGAMDVSMNGQAVLVERSWNKSIMSFFHATFSIGMVIGAGIGALATRLEIALAHHLFGVAFLGFIALIWASSHLIDDSKEVISSDDENTSFTLPTAAIMPIAIIAFCGMTGEGSLNDWSALFM
ncbi:MAG: MFS transporter, partial [Flavobacteriaceae bacterium]|nr:MFS transporter [Flavobacteriaceae bacterium]